MSSEVIQEFAERLVLAVRDSAIPQCDVLLNPRAQGPGAKRWREAAVRTRGPVPTSEVIPDCVDTAIFYVLHSMDDADTLHLSFTATGSELIDLAVVGWGEPAGWYVGHPCWRSWYSNERIVDRDDYRETSPDLDIPDDPAPNLDELEMPRRAIEELGILLVRHVRDVAIQSCDLQLLPHSQTPMAKRWRKAAIPFNGKVPPEVLIPDCVDETIYTFLRAIDKGLLPLSFTAENGETVDLTKDGNLAGRYIEPGGWRDQFSKERIGEANERDE